MKRYLNYAPAFVAVMGIAAAAIRFWIVASADDRGLFSQAALPRLLLWLVTLITAAAVACVCLFMKNSRKYSASFPASTVGFAGLAAGGVCIGVSSVAGLLKGGELLSVLASVLGLAAAAALLLMASCRRQGVRPKMVLPGIVCVFLIVWLLKGFRSWTSMTQVDEYLFMQLASVCLMAAAFQDTAFCCGKGKRKLQALSHLAALFFCIGALPGCADPAAYLGGTLWMGTNVCVIWRRK